MTLVAQFSPGRDALSGDSNLAVILRSPGTVDMVGIAALAAALKRPVGAVSKAIYQAPTVLVRGVDPQNKSELDELCGALGLDIEFAHNDVILPDESNRYDVAVHINDPECIPAATETLARLLGVAPDKAFRLLATPPGLILGDVSLSAADALAQRFGTGCTVSAAVSGEGPFDLYLPDDARIDATLEAECSGQRGLVLLGLDKDAATKLFPRLPKGTARLIPRALLRFDLLLMPQSEVSDQAVRWIAGIAGSEENEVSRLLKHAPVMLSEGQDYVEGVTRQAQASNLGVETQVEAHGFLRSHITVTEAANAAAMAEVLEAAGLETPRRLPCRIASNLPDLDARWLAHKLEMAGVSFLFEDAEG